MSKKKDNSGGLKAAVLVLVGLIIVFGILLTYMHYKNMGQEGKDAAQAEREKGYTEVYDVIVNMTDDNYPRKPDEVMQLYTKFYELMYANFLDDDKLKELVIKGRIFFGAKLIEMNPEDAQLFVLENEINELNDKGISVLSVVAEPCMASPDDAGVYTSYVTRKMSNGLTTYWKYYLSETKGGLYKIRGWERAEQKKEQ